MTTMKTVQKTESSAKTVGDLAWSKEEKMPPQVVSIVAKNGTGKTTLLKKLITSPARVAMVKQNQNQEPSLIDVIFEYCQDLDIVLTAAAKELGLSYRKTWT